MGFQSTIYNTLFKKTSTFYLTIAACSFFFERTFDLGSEAIFDRINEGKQWKDIQKNYEK